MPSERDNPNSKKNEGSAASQVTPGQGRSASSLAGSGALADGGDPVIHEEEKTMVHAVTEKAESA